MMGNPRFRLHGLTRENETNVKALLNQYRNKLNLPLRILREKEIDEIVDSLQKDVFCRVLLSDNDIFGAIVAEKSTWDSHHFGFGVGKIRSVIISDILSRQDAVKVHEVLIRSCMTWMKRNKAKCVMARVDLDGVDGILAYAINGFQLADVLGTYHLDVDCVKPASESQSCESITIRSSRGEDIPKLMKIARSSFTKDHFHRDSDFPQDKSDELFARWVYNSCHGSADTVLVAVKENEEPCGFIACKIEKTGAPRSLYGIIDLIAVSPLLRGLGIGTRLVREAITWFTDSKDVKAIFVGTQANNISSVRMYEKAGFRLLRSELTLHKWF